MWLYLKHLCRPCESRNPGVSSLKREFGESYDKQYLKETMVHCRKHNYLDAEDRKMVVVPIPFSTQGAYTDVATC